MQNKDLEMNSKHSKLGLSDFNFWSAKLDCYV